MTIYEAIGIVKRVGKQQAVCWIGCMLIHACKFILDLAIVTLNAGFQPDKREAAKKKAQPRTPPRLYGNKPSCSRQAVADYILFQATTRCILRDGKCGLKRLC
jgi:hypothetical protein